ncbi:hypothetical protein JX265_012257 [Neoarthrinium moseri]|uniref:lytic cellulose monooxygenase (C4-dehydrogenating) n=1 Tax=Neoarthrinium moseri TaxID=1658444 RepID=A0A9P9WAI4_9PEZI|nr:uncharacterized protein JN550_004427 [Neoarthrinium moseri]KAI1849792.1 hypothetical protein JX266_004741 [Neoarthrinium moseri]KAI1855069.1 hypothetical protein JX265_012257 [Neoarthrinium moseri]KAI1871433.1 hypothetical protein JN550_004427 [Neoarthrinium moseri]
MFPTQFACWALLVTFVAGHGYVQQIKMGNQLVDTWNPYKDPQKKVTKITRKFPDNGPVTDGKFTTDAITCNYGIDGEPNNVPVNMTASVASGSKLTFYWTDWQSDHPGPIMTYLASCGGSCKTFSGSTGNVWVKIHQAGYDASLNPPWASKRLPTQNSVSHSNQETKFQYNTWSITLPSSIAPGEYLLRHEILGLQRTNNNGSGSTKLPTGIALPGAYQPDDKKSIFLEYRDISASNPYTAPGGQVWGDKGWSDLQNMVAT